MAIHMHSLQPDHFDHITMTCCMSTVAKDQSNIYVETRGSVLYKIRRNQFHGDMKKGLV